MHIKKITIMKFFSIISFLSILFIAGCSKNEIIYGDYNLISPNDAMVKINYNSSYFKNPGVFIKLNGERLTNLVTTRTVFPGGGYNVNGDVRANYLTVPAGNTTVSVVIPKKGTGIDSVELYTTNFNVEAAKGYTVHITDTAANTKSLVTEDDLTNPPLKTSKYRFVNLMPNVAAVDLYYKDTLIVSNIGYLKASDYITKPTTPLQAWNVRETGKPLTDPVLATYSNAGTIVEQRSYTVFAIGYKGIASTDNTRKPYVSFLFVR